MSRWAFFKTRLDRSAEYWRDYTARIIRMDGLNEPYRGPLPLLSFNARRDLEDYLLGCDSDIGGFSAARLDFVPDDPNQPNGKGKTRFWGDMRLGVRKEFQGRIRTGYAGFRSKSRPTLFGELLHDVQCHEYLALRVRVGGHPRTHNAYFVNLQTDSRASGELWQHRMHFRKTDGSWENIFVPFRSFGLTCYGEPVTGKASSFGLGSEPIRWIGISILGGNAGIEGPFELGLDSVSAVNQDIVKASNTNM